MKTKKIKGSFSDLKPALKSLKQAMQEYERGNKTDQYELQEEDLKSIRRHGQSNNG